MNLPTATANGAQATTTIQFASNPDVGRRGIFGWIAVPYGDISTQVTQVESVWGGWVAPSNAPLLNRELIWRFYNTANVGIDNYIGAFPPGGTHDAPFTYVDYSDTGIRFRLWAIVGQRNDNTGQPPNGNIYLEKLTFRGYGKNPFTP
jgi:hypothetical protein